MPTTCYLLTIYYYLLTIHYYLEEGEGGGRQLYLLPTYYSLLPSYYYLEECEGGGRQLAMRNRRGAPQRLSSLGPRLQP